MSQCHDNKNGRTCYGMLFKCSSCGRVGCKENGCTGRQFDANGRCLTCGKSSKIRF